jgi:crossover junction endodeoxyribonuclease RusA
VIVLELPLPPSVNRYWRFNPKSGQAYVTAAGKAYRAAVIGVAKHLRSTGRIATAALSGRLRVGVVLCPPDERRRDLDNVLKALLDALTHARVYGDDEQIDDLRVVRGDLVAGGAVVVTVDRISTTLPRAA